MKPIVIATVTLNFIPALAFSVVCVLTVRHMLVTASYASTFINSEKESRLFEMATNVSASVAKISDGKIEEVDFQNQYAAWTIVAANLSLILLLFFYAGYTRVISERNAKDNKKVPQILPWLSKIPLADILYFLYRMDRDGIHLVDTCTQIFGPISTFTMAFERFYLISEPVLAEKILGSSDPRLLNKAKIVDLLIRISGLGNGIGGMEAHEWTKRRKLLAPSFSYKYLQHYAKVIDDNAKKMMNDLHELRQDVLKGSEVNEIQALYLIKSISSIVMRNEVATDEENHKFRMEFESGKEITMYRFYHPWFLIDFLWQFHPKYKIIMGYIESIHSYLMKLIGTVKAEQSRDMEESSEPKSRSLMEDLIGSGLSEEGIKDEVLTFLFAGHETTTVAISLLMFHLAANPAEQTRCQEEIDKLFESSNAQEELTMDDLAKLKQLERCALESLRLTPVLPLITRRIETSVKIDEFNEIPAGSNAIISAWSLHRNPDIYPDPLKFQPDRFLPENCKGRSLYAFLSFSGGPRNCIGWKVAIMQIKVVMARILKDFDLFTNEKFENVKFLNDVSLRPEKEIPLELKQRRKS